MEPGSKAERLVLSFPCYCCKLPKGDRSTERKIWTRRLLVQIYVRDLLNLVMKMLQPEERRQIYPYFYDELEMESCLPPEVLVAWERSRNHQTESEGSRSLEQLMNFLRQEVKGEEMVLWHGPASPPPESTKKGLSCNTGQEKLIRAVIDSGSQSTYVSENVITHLKALPLRSETVIHALFRGSETKPKKHDIFPVEGNGNQSLIGADVLGKLLTGNSVELESGLTAVETKLGNCQPQHEEVAQKLKSSFYVTIMYLVCLILTSRGRFIEHAKLIMLNGCFNLRGFESNVAGKNVDRSSGDTSVLGVIWNLETDTLKCCTDMDTLTCETKITKD
ncbi:uncharacterized protein TNCV_4595631 [Trichonephila clavipes]|uniref:Uncharacterized protein n=1 Tax=Trichonephila clavipes TaxID=2585209 RepID=A0A8X6WGB5_TRICX|nr:uncharacterized protein TNCV_4595631 [Trichonephila clavipes]